MFVNFTFRRINKSSHSTGDPRRIRVECPNSIPARSLLLFFVGLSFVTVRFCSERVSKINCKTRTSGTDQSPVITLAAVEMSVPPIAECDGVRAFSASASGKRLKYIAYCCRPWCRTQVLFVRNTSFVPSDWRARVYVRGHNNAAGPSSIVVAIILLLPLLPLLLFARGYRPRSVRVPVPPFGKR